LKFDYEFLGEESLTENSVVTCGLKGFGVIIWVFCGQPKFGNLIFMVRKLGDKQG